MHEAGDRSLPLEHLLSSPSRRGDGDSRDSDASSSDVPTREEQLARLEHERQKAHAEVLRPPEPAESFGTGGTEGLLNVRLHRLMEIETARERLQEAIFAEEVGDSNRGSSSGRTARGLPGSEGLPSRLDPSIA